MFRAATVFIFILLSVFSVSGQSLDVNIKDGFRLGNADLLKPYLEEEIEIILPAIEGKYSLDRSVKYLQQFFNSSGVSGFTLLHEGSSPEGTSYHIGLLSTDNGRFRTYILLSKSKNRHIAEIRIEKDE